MGAPTKYPGAQEETIMEKTTGRRRLPKTEPTVPGVRLNMPPLLTHGCERSALGSEGKEGVWLTRKVR